MQKILLNTDLSARYSSIFIALATQRSVLEKHGLFMPLPFSFGAISSHGRLWTFANQDETQAPPDVVTALQEVANFAEKGGDILLYGAAIQPIFHRKILEKLRHMPALKSYKINMLFTLGRIACRLEQDLRRMQYRQGILPSRTAMVEFVRSRYLATDLLTLARRECGIDHVDVLVDNSESCVDRGDPVLLGKVFEYLGCPPPKSTPPCTIEGIASQQNAHFAHLLCSQCNQYPPIQESSLIQCLQRQEQGLYHEQWLVSPPVVRARALEYEREILPPLAELAACPVSDLSMPLTMYPRVRGTPCSPLTEQDANRFISLLPSDVKKSLKFRLSRDMLVLSSEEQLLASILVPEASSRPAPLVTVLTLAYNHAAYIADAIESVLAQQTDFPVEHIIVDHCSTDGTQEIITKYADKHASIWPVLMARRSDKGANVRALFSRCRSKYVAICDGDDYFTDPFKLQKQVNFLETHTECGLCFHPVDVLYEDGTPPRVYPPEDLLPGGIRRFYTINDLFFANIIQTNSVMYRWRFQDGLPDWFDSTLVPGDWYWHLLHAETGLIGYLRDHMAVYRRHPTSLYATAEGNHVTHRNVHGINELRTYGVINKHFQGRYYKDLQRLASGVFADFLQIYISTADDTLLKQGCEICPDFGRDFLSQIQILNGDV